MRPSGLILQMVQPIVKCWTIYISRDTFLVSCSQLTPSFAVSGEDLQSKFNALANF